MTLTLEQARERCAFWQRVLRLQDWDVDVVIARRCAMPSGSSAAATVWTSNTARQATITLLDPVDFQPIADARECDMEDSLVHELLHLHTHDLRIPHAAASEPYTAQEIAEERLIVAVADALVRLQRAATTTIGGGL